MAWNGSGTYVLPSAYTPAVNGTIIDAADYNGALNDIATGISNCFAADGQKTPTANIPMGSFKFTGLAAGSADGQSVRYEQVYLQAEESVTASAGTTDISTTRAATLVINASGTPAITGFGTATAGFRRFVRVGGAFSVTYNSTSMKTPGAANLTFAVGDVFDLVSLGSGNWKIDSYTLNSGVAVSLNQVGAASAAASSNHTDYTITWQWKLTSSTYGLKVNEPSASTFAGGILLYSETTTTSTAVPFLAKFSGASSAQDGYFGFFTNGGVLGSLVVRAGTGGTTHGGALELKSGAAINGNGGAVNITTTGGATSGTGGDINLTTGAGASAAAGNIVMTPSLTGATKGQIQFAGYMRVTSGTAPTISSGAGTGAAISGYDNAFGITTGTSPASPIVINLGRTIAGGYAVANCTQSGITLHCTVSTTQISIAYAGGTLSSGQTITVIMLGA